MPQARLPDINAAFTKHRNEVVSSIKSQNWDSVFGALYALNALLPDTIDEETGMPKYRVVISDIEYERLTKPTVKLICHECEEATEFDKIKVFDALMPFMDQCISQTKTEKMWLCPSCKEVCKIRLTVKKETQLKEPYYLGVVPKPPLRHEGLQDRTRYNRKVTQWAWTLLDELESKMALFRDDNWQKGDDQTDVDTEDVEGGEEEF